MTRPSRIAALLVAATATAACTAGGTSGSSPGSANSPGASGGSAGGGGTLTIAYQADVASLDPDNNFEVAGLGTIKAVYQGLVDYKPGTTEIEGDLARSWEISKDGRTYTFHLQDGVKFHDGKAMTSASVKAAFARRADSKYVLSYFLGNVAETKAPDPRTFVIRLKSRQLSFLDSLASPWGPKVVGPVGLGKPAKWLNEHADGTGPFELTQFKRGQQYQLTRFDDYWGESAHFQKVRVKIIPDVGAQTLQLRNGDLDMMLHGYPYAQLGQLPEGLAIEAYNDLGLEMGFVNTKGRLRDPAQRANVIAALDPAGWVQDAFGDYADPPQSLFPVVMLKPEQPYEFPAASEKNPPGVVQIAYTTEEASVQQRVADLLIAQLGQAGIKATARAVPGTQISSYPKNAAAASTPDLLIAQNNPDSAHPDSQSGLFYVTGAPLNIFGYSNPKADRMFSTGADTVDTAERDRLYAEGGRLIFQDGAFVPLADVKDVIVYREGLTDFNTRPDVPWNVDLGTVRQG